MVATREEAIALLLGERRHPARGAVVGRSREPPAPAAGTTSARPSTRTCASPAGRAVGPALAAGARPAVLPARRARPHLDVRRHCTARSGATTTSATAPTCSRWSSGCAASCATSAARTRSAPSAASGFGWSTSAMVGPHATAERARRCPRLDPWTSTPPTTTGSPGSPPARCRSRSPTRRPTRARCSSRRGPATTTASRWRCSPSCALSGYAIDDLFLQDTLLDGGARRRSPRSSRASADLLPVLVVGAPLVHGTRVLNCAVVDPPRPGPRRRAEVLPADLPRVLRAPLVRARRRPARRARSPLAGDEVPFGPDLIFEATDVPGLQLHVEICEDMWVPVPPSAEAALAGATVLANLSGSPITVGPRRGPPAAGPQRERALPRGVRLRGRGPGRVDHRPVAGTARRWSTSAATCWRETERFPDGPRRTGRRRRPRPDPPGAAAPGHVRRQPPRRSATGSRELPHASTFELQPPDRRHRAAPQGRPLPVRARRRRAARAGLLRGLQHPGLRARAAAARDRPAQGRHRRQRRPRLHARADRRGEGDGPARPPAQRHPRVHDAGLRDRRRPRSPTPPGSRSRSA